MAGSRSPIVDRSLLPCALGSCDGRTPFLAARARGGVRHHIADRARSGPLLTARANSFALLGVVTISLVLREFFLVTTLSGRGTSAFSVLVDAVPIVAPTPNIVSWNRPIERLSSPSSASGAVSETNASTGFLRNTLRRSVDGVLMSVVLAESVGSLDQDVHRLISLLHAGLSPLYRPVPRLV